MTIRIDSFDRDLPREPMRPKRKPKKMRGIKKRTGRKPKRERTDEKI